ncbi:MAG: hypothetical protein ABI406_17145, partial [Ktedonobacteraceae bacterium]
MNLLIIGGLFAIAIVAVIGIVLLFLGERGAEATRKANAQSTAPAIAKTARPTVPLIPSETREPVSHPVANEPVIQRRTLP